MKVVGISGSIVGSKTKIAMEYTLRRFNEKYPEAHTQLLNLGQLDIVFSDGRDYRDYEGDTKFLTESIMKADILIIGTPTFQASIPGTLKNVFDLLPEGAFREKVVGIVATAGSSKHFLMVEQQLKPILSYMKANIVQKYVFIEEQDYYRKEIMNDDVLFRIDHLIDDTIQIYRAMEYARKEREAMYDF